MMTHEFWAYYIIIGIALIGLEILVSGFYLLPIGTGFLISAVFSLFIEDRSLMHFISAVLIVSCLVIMRKYFKRTQTDLGTPTDEMIGREIVIESEIDLGGRGYGKIFGESWAVVPEDTNRTFSKGETAIIVAMDGNKLKIRKK